MPDVHAVLSASSSHRWLVCTPSARLEQPEPDSTSEFAREGTEAHALAEKKLKSWIKTQKRSKFKAPDGEMDEYTSGYRDYVIEIYNEAKKQTPDAELLIEQKLDFSRWVPDGFGTGDAVIIADDVLHVIDLKYGKGVRVEAEGNTQARLYAAGAMDSFGILYDFDKVKVHIYQPRIDNISTAEYSLEELEKWMDEYVRPRADAAYKGEGKQVPGDHCRFCKIRGKCRARAEKNVAVFKKYDENEDYIFDKAMLEELLPMLDEIDNWVGCVKEYALQQALQGEKFKGWKVVEGRSNRKITNEEGLIEALEKDGYKKEQFFKKPALETITALEKLVGKKHFKELSEGFIEKPPGKPALVEESDKRPEWNSAVEDFKEFED